MSIDPNNLICVAKITGTHGINGILKVASFADDPNTVFNAKVLYDKSGKKTFKLEGAKPHKNAYLCKLNGIENPEDGALLRGQELYIERDNLPNASEDEFYYVDLIGLDARLENGEKAGEVLAVQNHGAGDMIEVKPASGKSFMVPFTEAHVPKVNFDDRFLTIIPLKYIDDDE